MTETKKYDVIIVGAGAAGLMCAIEAGKRGRTVLLIDHAKSVGEKIRISGGGRCNFTNVHASADHYLSHNPHFCKSALRRYSQWDFIDLVQQYGIAYHEKTLGQLFCDGSSKQIIQMLLDECTAAKVNIALKTDIQKIKKADQGFILVSSTEETLFCGSLVIATGGPSIPKMGATGWGYQIAQQFNMKVIMPRAALVPFTLSGTLHDSLKTLSGLSVPVTVTCGDCAFTEAMLFTHRGLSGPVMLQISSYWQEGQAIIIDLAPNCDVREKLKEIRQSKPKQELHTAIASFLPKALAQYLCKDWESRKNIADYSNDMLQEISNRISAWSIVPSGTEGFRTAEVTLGGVDTNEISSKTFEAKNTKGLFFIGEVVDVTGHLGGFNFQWAWSSGYAAGQYV